MAEHRVVSRSEWIEAREALLGVEKDLTRLRDRVSERRRALPWVRIDKPYMFEGADGPVSMGDLFGEKSQLIVYHFMFGPDWEEGCPSCSFWIDNLEGALPHLPHRDVHLVAVSKAPIAKLLAYRKRMGWSIDWYSAGDSGFNEDFGVTFSPEVLASGEAVYNYRPQGFSGEQAPGLSVFFRDAGGTVYHTYSCYARGLDSLNGAYQLLDLVPKGRDEDGLKWPMEWVRRHDRYE